MAREFFRKHYGIGELYTAIYRGMRTVGCMRKSRKSGEMTAELTERIMLAVTEVNGCEVCSYFHTRVSLESGMSAEEISSLLSGDTRSVSPQEAPAVMFAQHYADTRGNPSRSSWERLVSEYGENKAKGILAASRMIMIGNIWGLSLSALRRRLKGMPVKNSGIIYELGMILSIVPFAPAACIHALVSNIIRLPVLKFTSGEAPRE